MLTSFTRMVFNISGAGWAIRWPEVFLAFFFTLTPIFSITAQEQSPRLTHPQGEAGAIGSEVGVFSRNEVMDLRIEGPVHALMQDRSDQAKLYRFRLGGRDDEGQDFSIPVDMRTRGKFRRLHGNCTFPPLSILFIPGDSLAATPFREQKKLKLVVPCRGEEYVIREWLAYRIYQLLSPLSFRARMVRLDLKETRRNKKMEPIYGFLLEEDWQVAKRNNMQLVEKKVQPGGLMRRQFLEMTVFQYLIGNTDWSVQYLQNIKLMSEDSVGMPYAVPYDFDMSGMVSAPYAVPAEELKMHSVKERRYRGFCVKNLDEFLPVLEKFQRVKAEIYALYKDVSLIDEKYRIQALRYLDEFYAIVDNEKLWRKAFAYPCDPNGTGNVVIRGLQN